MTMASRLQIIDLSKFLLYSSMQDLSFDSINKNLLRTIYNVDALSHLQSNTSA